MGAHLRRSVFDCRVDRWTRGLELRRRVLAFGVRTVPSGAEGRCCTSGGRRRRRHFAAPEENSGWTYGRPARRWDKDRRTRTDYRFEEDAMREVAPWNGRRTCWLYSDATALGHLHWKCYGEVACVPTQSTPTQKKIRQSPLHPTNIILPNITCTSKKKRIWEQ